MRFKALLALAFVGLSAKVAAATATNAIATNCVLMIDRCFTRVAGGKATLTIGPLQPSGATFTGDYAMKVSPYFFKNQKGKLSIHIPAESFEKAGEGRAVEISGTATDSADGVIRRIDAIATPSDSRRGTLNLWFVADGRRMDFATSYQIVAPESSQTTGHGDPHPSKARAEVAPDQPNVKLAASPQGMAR